MKENVVQTKSFQFALRIVKLARHLQTRDREFVISRQVLRSGTAVGALISESEHAESTADFIHKLAIAQKELNESMYWLRLIRASEFIDDSQFDSIFRDADELMKILSSILLTLKNKKGVKSMAN